MQVTARYLGRLPDRRVRAGDGPGRFGPATDRILEGGPAEVHTVELLLDAELDHGVRNLWELLSQAGLPSLAAHPHPTNRPHLTVVSASSLAGLPPLSVPVAADLGHVRILGRALVREVVMTAELREIHARTWSALAGAEAWPSPAEWVPHVSLALKVPADRQQEALRLLGAVPPARGQFVAARSYDSRTREVLDL